MSWKVRLKRGIHWLSYLSGASTLRARHQRVMRIIMFHGIGGEEYPAKVLEAQLRYLKKRFSIVPLESILRKATAVKSAPVRDMALTFDDGLRNHFGVVYPILQRLNIPATFFVCPGLVETGRWLWNHEARERLRSLPTDQRAALCMKLQAPVSEADEIVEWMKSLSLAKRRTVEDDICRMTPNFEATAYQKDQYDPMTWEELSSIETSLVTIGSHTVSHPILTTLSPSELSYEIGISRQWLEERLQRPIKHFCYPSGAYNTAVLACVRQHYDSATASTRGCVKVGDDAHSLRRINTAPGLPRLAWHMHRWAT